MPRKKKLQVNPAAVLKTYAGGATLAELREKFGIKGKGQLASAVLEALIKSGKMPPIARGGVRRETPSEFKVAVNLRGTIVLPKQAVADAFHFTQGQSFVARRRGTKIILTLVK